MVLISDGAKRMVRSKFLVLIFVFNANANSSKCGVDGYMNESFTFADIGTQSTSYYVTQPGVFTFRSNNPEISSAEIDRAEGRYHCQQNIDHEKRNHHDQIRRHAPGQEISGCFSFWFSLFHPACLLKLLF